MNDFNKKLEESLSFKTRKNYKKDFWNAFDNEFSNSTTSDSLSSRFKRIAKFYIPGFLSFIAIVFFTSTYFIKQSRTANLSRNLVTIEFLDNYEMNIEEDENDFDQSFI